MDRVKIRLAELREVKSVQHAAVTRVNRVCIADKVAVTAYMTVAVENRERVPVKPTKLKVTFRNPRILHNAEAEVRSGPDVPPGMSQTPEQCWLVVFRFDDKPEITTESFPQLIDEEGMEIGWADSEDGPVKVTC